MRRTAAALLLAPGLSGDDRFAYEYDARGRFPPDTVAQPDVEAFANGTHTFERQTRPDETTYRAY